jgi:hypothetical protein
MAIYDKVCQWLEAGQWFSPGTLVSSTNKTDCHDLTEIVESGVLLRTSPIKDESILSSKDESKRNGPG